MPAVRKSVFLGALVLTALAPPAHGQSGQGLYEPFPEPNSIERSKDFVEDLRTAQGEAFNLSDDELEAGVIVDVRTGKASPAPQLDQGASDRADGGGGLAPVIAWAAVLGLVALFAAALTRIPGGLTPRRS